MIEAEYEAIAGTQQSDTNSVFNSSFHTTKSTTSVTSNGSVKYNSLARKEYMKKMTGKHFNKHANDQYSEMKCHRSRPSEQYLKSATFVTRSSLWAILYLALNISGEKIQLGDMIRYCREGHISYFNLKHFIPEEYLSENQNNDLLENAKYKVPCHKQVRTVAYKIAKMIKVKNLNKPNLYTLCDRYCSELELPSFVAECAEKLSFSNVNEFTDKLSENGPISNYEGRAMAYIILILKLIFGLDDHTEYVISEKVNVLNNVFKEIDENHTPIFSWEHWSCFIEYRKLLISQKQLPSHLNSNTHANSKMFVTLWNKLKCSDELTDSKTEQLMTVMKKIFSDLKDLQCDKFNDVLVFEPSLTPYKDYFNVILEICKDIVLPENVICKHRQFDFSFFINGSKNQINLSDDNVTLRFKNKSSNKNLHIWNANEEIEYKYDKSYIHKLNRHEIVNIHPIGSMEWKIKLDNKFRKINDCDNNADQAKRRSLGLIKEFQDIQTMKHESNQEIEAIKCAKFGGSVDVKEFQNVIIEKTKFPDKSLDERCKKFKNIHSKLLLYRDKYKKFTSGVCEGRKKWFMSPKVYNPLLDEQTLRLGQKILPDIIHNSSPEKNCGDHVINIPRPVSHYWVNHFSNSVPVTNILFESMETKFSSTFSWLLEECARVVEMSKFDLYNELIEIEQQLGLIQFPDRNRKTI